MYPTLASGRAARGCELADKPAGFDWVGEPGFGPTLLDAGLDGAGIDLLALGVEERELAAGLIEAALQPSALRWAWHGLPAHAERAHHSLPRLSLRAMLSGRGRLGQAENHRE